MLTYLYERWCSGQPDLWDLMGEHFQIEELENDTGLEEREIKPDRNDTGFLSYGIWVAQLCPEKNIPLDHFRSYVAEKNSIGEVIFKKLNKVPNNNPISCPGPGRGVFSGDRRDPLFDRLHDGDRWSRFPSQAAFGLLNFNLFQKCLGKFLLFQRNLGRFLDSLSVGKIIRYMPLAISWVNSCHNNHRDNIYTESGKKQQNRVEWLRIGDVSGNRKGYAEGTIRLE